MTAVVGIVPGCPDYGYTEDFQVFRITPKRGTRAGRVVRSFVDSHGYVAWNIRTPAGKLKTVLRAWLVCTHFHGKRPSGLFCLHGDGNPQNDAPDNLRWGTAADNIADMLKHGRGGGAAGSASGSVTKPDSTPRGERHPRAKLTESNVRSIRAESLPDNHWAEKFGVTRVLIGKIRRREIWRAVA